MLIFDECHRSQFGDMHKLITKALKKYFIFGFTGTPIKDEIAKKYSFSKDLNKPSEVGLTTEKLFGKCLHSYTIADAVRDKNVLPFKVEYHSTMKAVENIEDKKVKDIDRESALMDNRRIEKIASYILEKFDEKTFRNKQYSLKDRRLRGFNSIFATASIEAAMKYYSEFQRQIRDLSKDKRLKIAIIYSFGANESLNEDEGDGEENKSNKEFLENAMKDYNAMFKSNYTLSGFENYYKDVSLKMKERELDMLIVVNMFLTGFDATTLNTLWVDKNLRNQGLLQAYSRTNRILNSVKSFGNIVCFRNLEKATNESLLLFGSKDSNSVVLLRSFKEYLEGYIDKNGKSYRGYNEVISELKEKYFKGEEISADIISATIEEKKAFIKLFNELLKLNNILSSFDEFKRQELLSEAQKQGLQSAYINVYEEIQKLRQKDEKAQITDDIVFELELIKQIDINIDYILKLISENLNNDKTEIVINITKLLESSLKPRSKKELILNFLDSVNAPCDVELEFEKFTKEQKRLDFLALVQKFRLDEAKSKEFLRKSFRNGYIEELGEDIENLLPKEARGFFGEAGEKKSKIKRELIDAFKDFYERYHDISNEEI